jgi:hypothetical protein
VLGAALDMQRQILALARVEFPVTHDFLADKKFTEPGVGERRFYLSKDLP